MPGRFVAAGLGLVAAALLLVGGCSGALPTGAGRGGSPPTWTAAWGSAQLTVNIPTPAPPLQDVSLRQLVRVNVSGETWRVRISNLLGTDPLEVGAASVAAVLSAPAAAAGQALQPPVIDAASLRPLRFSGRRDLTLAPGAEAWSDPVALPMTALTDLAVQLHVRRGASPATVHPGSRISSWMVSGGRVDDAAWPDAAPREGWWHLAAVDVAEPALPAGHRAVLVATGDSITDGYGVPPGTHQRWTDVLARRLQAAGRADAVVNTGIGGGRLLRDGLGPNLLSRFDRDLLDRSGVTHGLVLIGVNDLGVHHRQRQDTDASRAALLREMKAGFEALAARARARGVCLIGATILPYGSSGYYQPRAENEADRTDLNDWLRTSGIFDAVIDFDRLMRDPARPSQLRPDLDSGDGLHPSMAGYRAMAEHFPLELLDRRCTRPRKEPS